jgi:ubiquitin C-terminal hydrolase
MFQMNKMIEVDLKLELGETIYELFSLIDYDYSSYVMKGGQWYHHQENEITEATEVEVKRQTWPYMLCYRKVE